MKAKFIREASTLFVASHWQRPTLERAIKLAEDLWEMLIAKNYGPATTQKGKKEPKTRNSVDHYEKLTDMEADSGPSQKWVFDQFWKNFSKHGDRNRSAMVLIKLWESIQPEYKWLLGSALIEAQLRTTRETTPPYGEKWLNNYSWRNHSNPEHAKANQQKTERREKLRELTINLTAFKQQLKNDDSETLKNVIKEIEADIKKLREEN